MPGFIRKVRTGSGATAVQIVYKRGREVVGVRHIGPAHNEVEPGILVARAKEEKDAAQLKLFEVNEPEVYLERSYSGLLWDALISAYRLPGFDCIKDEVFQQLDLARIANSYRCHFSQWINVAVKTRTASTCR